jgi:hypothetical protein
MDAFTEKRLDRTANILSGLKDRFFIRSDNLSKLKEQEGTPVKN